MTVFQSRDYKVFLEQLSELRGKRSGFKSRLAEACGCNSAYISSVLGGHAHFSLEQAERACELLEFSKEETHYFLLLVQRARAGTPRLAAYFDGQLDELLAQRSELQKHLGARENLSKEQQAQYYSSWMYAAIHVAVSIPRLAKSAEAMAEYFEVPLPAVKKVLEFLVTAGMAAAKGSGYTIGPRHIHLGKSSENLLRHHINFRLATLKVLELGAERHLNYSSAVALSSEDAGKVREILLAAVKKSVDLILDSPSEQVYALSVDFVELGR